MGGVVVAGASALVLAACGASGDQGGAPDAETGATGETSAASAAGAAGAAGGTSAAGATGGTQTEGGTASPLVVTNCGAEVTFESAPERVLLLKSASVPYLDELDILDRVISRAGAYPQEYYSDETWAALEAIPLLTDQLDPAGHLQISREVILAEEPDLVMGLVDSIDRQALADAGINLLEEPALCPGGSGEPSFETVLEQFEMYGQVFDVPEAAAAASSRLEERLDALREGVESAGERTAAVLYPTVGGGPLYAYGTSSMAHPQLEAAGFENVFGDTETRVFEIGVEQLLGRDPDAIVLLHSDGDPAGVEAALMALQGADQLTAVREGRVLVQLFNFTEPPSPLAVDGAERIVEELVP